MKRRIIGIDLGITKENPTALALLGVPELELLDYLQIIPPPKMEWVSRILWVARDMQDKLEHLGLSRSSGEGYVLAYEMPFVMPKFVQTSIKLSHVGGCVMAWGVVYNCPVVPVSNHEAKKRLAGKGNATKVQMIQAVNYTFHVSVTKDVADAIGVAMAGWDIYNAS